MIIYKFKVQLIDVNWKISTELIECNNMNNFGRALNKLEERGFMIRRTKMLKPRIKAK
jgi:hypothetical protein